MVILGIDTSCDDTGIGIVDGRRVLANVVSSQAAIHAPFGGVVPEQASREHLMVIDTLLEQALEEAQLPLEKLEAVAATYGPGLVGTLLIGLSYGKALAWARNLPFFAVHHLEGHIAASVAAGEVFPPFLCLIASGGHTSLFEVKGWWDYRELGRTRDDAAGEAFDKVARLLGLDYPGGPALSVLAEGGDDAAHPLPIPLRKQSGFDFSFSGLKTAVALLLRQQPDIRPADVAASFERVVAESLVTVTVRAAAATGLTDLVVGGGVAANRVLRRRFQLSGLRVHFPPAELTTDNGAMIALAAGLWGGRSAPDHLGIDASPYLPLATIKGAGAS